MIRKEHNTVPDVCVCVLHVYLEQSVWCLADHVWWQTVLTSEKGGRLVLRKTFTSHVNTAEVAALKAEKLSPLGSLFYSWLNYATLCCPATADSVPECNA